MRTILRVEGPHIARSKMNCRGVLTVHSASGRIHSFSSSCSIALNDGGSGGDLEDLTALFPLLGPSASFPPTPRSAAVPGLPIDNWSR
jgi:hypothetical protein